MPFLLVVYGAAFVAGGFALLLQARATVDTQPLPRIALGLLAGFALVHGASEWTSMGVAIEVRGHEPPSADLVAASLLLLAASFALLFAFGAALLVRHEHRLAHVIAGGLVPLVLCGVLVSRFLRSPAASNGPTKESLEAIIRYVLGVPACLSAAVGLLALRRSMATEETRTLHHIAIAAGVFVSYGILAGVVVPRAPFAPASFLNANAFQQNVHLPIEVLRAACAVAIVVLISEAFVVEPFHRLEQELVHVRAEIHSLLGFEVRDRLKDIERGSGLLAALPAADHGSERERGVVEAIRASARFVYERVTDLVDTSELESHRLELTRESLDVRPLLIRAGEQLYAGGHPATRVRVDCPEKLPTVVADPTRVEQVLTRVIASASRHAAGTPDLLIRVEEERDAVAISVLIRGGVPAYRVPYVFSRDRADVTDRRGGTWRAGTGLHLARGLVEAMGGHLSFESVPNSHATFRFTLPLSRAVTADVPVPRRAE